MARAVPARPLMAPHRPFAAPRRDVTAAYALPLVQIFSAAEAVETAGPRAPLQIPLSCGIGCYFTPIRFANRGRLSLLRRRLEAAEAVFCAAPSQSLIGLGRSSVASY